MKETSHLGGNVEWGDAFTYCPSAWNYVISRFGIESVLDLGSGIGNASLFFHKKGLKVIAVDGLSQNVDASLYPAVRHDLTDGPFYTRVDLVHCQEVVEHIEEQHLENVIASLLTGKIIMMTHALPGQGGYHHVNEKPASYWVDHMTRNGCSLLEADTKRIRGLAQYDAATYMARTGLIFANMARI